MRDRRSEARYGPGPLGRAGDVGGCQSIALALDRRPHGEGDDGRLADEVSRLCPPGIWRSVRNGDTTFFSVRQVCDHLQPAGFERLRIRQTIFTARSPTSPGSSAAIRARGG